MRNFASLVADLGALPANSGALSIGFPAGQSATLTPLSTALATDDAQAAAALAQPNLSSNDAAFESARQLYAQSVRSDTLAYLDTQILPIIGASPTLGGRVKAWFSDNVERAAAAAGGFMGEWRQGVDWAARGIGIVLTRMVAFFFTAAVKVMIEADLFVLVLAMPFWLLPATEEAFYGVLRSLIWLSVVVPAYQFIMLFVDALMGLVLRYVFFGPLAVDGAGAAQTTGGVAYLVTAAVAVVGSGGEIVVLATFCYLVAYVFLGHLRGLQDPAPDRALSQGRQRGRGLSLHLRHGPDCRRQHRPGHRRRGRRRRPGRRHSRLGQRPGRRVVATVSRGLFRGARPGSRGLRQWNRLSTSFQPGFHAGTFRRNIPSVGESQCIGISGPAGVAAPRPQPTPAADVFRFGARTFLDALDADSPGEGLKTAVQAWEQHRKQREKAEEARYKAQAQAEKGPPPRSRKR